MSTATKTKFSILKPKEVLSETQFYTVEKIEGTQVRLLTDSGQAIKVDKAYVEELLLSASQFSKEETISRTELAQKFLSSSGVAMTVNFNKQVKEADVVKEIMEKISNASLKDIEKAVKVGVKKALEGEERVMVGRHFGEINEFGRVSFIDMEQTKAAQTNYDSRLRQVDPRTLNWIIVRGVKYKAK